MVGARYLERAHIAMGSTYVDRDSGRLGIVRSSGGCLQLDPDDATPIELAQAGVHGLAVCLAHRRRQVIAEVRLVGDHQRIRMLHGDLRDPRREATHVAHFEHGPLPALLRRGPSRERALESLAAPAVAGPNAGAHPGDIVGVGQIDGPRIEAQSDHRVHRGRDRKRSATGVGPSRRKSFGYEVESRAGSEIDQCEGACSRVATRQPSWPAPGHRAERLVGLHSTCGQHRQPSPAIGRDSRTYAFARHLFRAGRVGRDRVVERVSRTLRQRVGSQRGQEKKRAIVDDVKSPARPNTIELLSKRRPRLVEHLSNVSEHGEVGGTAFRWGGFGRGRRQSRRARPPFDLLRPRLRRSRDLSPSDPPLIDPIMRRFEGRVVRVVAAPRRHRSYSQ